MERIAPRNSMIEKNHIVIENIEALVQWLDIVIIRILTGGG